MSIYGSNMNLSILNFETSNFIETKRNNNFVVCDGLFHSWRAGRNRYSTLQLIIFYSICPALTNTTKKPRWYILIYTNEQIIMIAYQK